jgi:hypothetical protein
VEAKSDLISEDTWRQSDGGIWTYVGMIVTVAADALPENNGIYMLLSSDFSKADNWRECADITDIEGLQQQIDSIELAGGSLDLEVDSEAELPEKGDENTTYYVKDDKSIQRWDEETQDYVSYGGSPAMDITIINGGNANGTD